MRSAASGALGGPRVTSSSTDTSEAPPFDLPPTFQLRHLVDVANEAVRWRAMPQWEQCARMLGRLQACADALLVPSGKMDRFGDIDRLRHARALGFACDMSPENFAWLLGCAAEREAAR